MGPKDLSEFRFEVLVIFAVLAVGLIKKKKSFGARPFSFLSGLELSCETESLSSWGQFWVCRVLIIRNSYR